MTVRDTRSVGEVLQEIVADVKTLVVAEVGLLKLEVKDALDDSQRAVLRLVIGVALAHLALGFILLGSVHIMSQHMATWKACFIVAAVVAIGAAVFVVSGLEHTKEITNLKDVPDRERSSKGKSSNV